MPKVLKQGRTFTGNARVRVYQPEPGIPEQAGTGGGTDETENQEADSAGADGQDTTGKRYALASKEKRKILEHARGQVEQSATRILEKAYAQRDNIVSTTRGEAGGIHDQTETEGYNQGLNQALKDISQDMAGIQAAVDRLGQGLEELKRQINRRVAGLVFMMAEKVLRKKVEYDETELADMAAGAVFSERDKGNTTIHIPGGAVRLVEALERRLELLRDKMDGVLRIKAESRPPEFVQVETEEGVVDASLDVQLDNLKKQLMALNNQEWGSKYMGLDQIERVIEGAGLYTYLGKIDKTIGTAVGSTGPVYRLGDVCTIGMVESGSPAMVEVVGLRENKVLLMPYGEIEGVGYDSVVRNTGERLHMAVSNHLIGRTMDAMGNPIDDLGPVEDVSYYSITDRPSNPMTRPKIDTIIQMGVKAIDGLMTIGKGQRVGVFTGGDVGKSTLMSMTARNVEVDVNVTALVGERNREVVGFIHRDLGEEELRRSVLVVVASNQSAMMRSKCTIIVTIIIKYFKGRGMDMLLMMDSLTRFAMAQRKVGLSIEEPPVVRGHTPSIYSELPKPLERPGNFEEGSVAGIYTVLVERGDASEPISDTVRGIIDGHIILSRRAAARNHYPAIDILSSVSRLMDDIVTPEHKAATGKLRRFLSVYESNRNLVSIGAYEKGTNPELDDALERIGRIYGFFQRKTDESFSLDESVIQVIQVTD